MNISPYFTELIKYYRSELQDLTSDCDDKNILKNRLADKRNEFRELVPMIHQYPELVAVIFHGQVTLYNNEIINKIINLEPSDFPDWSSFANIIQFSEETQPIVNELLDIDKGNEFLIKVACLEYLFNKISDEEESSEENTDETEEESEQTKAETWLEQQGFDRLE
jgi:hypothetical protein